MAVTYTKEMRAKAEADNLWLVTIDGCGCCFQGPETKEGRDEIMAFLTKFLEKRCSGPLAKKGKPQ